MQASDDLFIVQIAGEDAGRVVGLREGVHLSIGSSPGASGDASLVSHDPDVSSLALRIIGGEAPVLEPHGLVELNGIPVAAPIVLVPGDVLSLGKYVRFRIATHEAADRPNQQGLVPFSPTNSTTAPVISTVNITAPRSPAESAKPDPPWLRVLYPLSGGVILLIAFPRWIFIFLLAVPIAIGLYDWYQGRRKAIARDKAEQHRFAAEWTTMREAIRVATAQQKRSRRATFPDKDDLYRAAVRRQPGLWSVDRTDSRFLTLRLGYGDLLATAKFSGSFSLEEMASINGLRQMTDVPVIFDFRMSHLACVGPTEDVASFWTALLSQMTVLFSPAHLQVVIGLPRMPSFSQAMTWTKWLPHTKLDSGANAVLVGRTRFDRVISQLAAEWGALTNEAADERPEVLVAVHEAVEPTMSLLERLAAAGRGRVHLFWAGSSTDRVPVMFGTVIDLADADDGVIATVVKAPSEWEWASRGVSEPVTPLEQPPSKFLIHMSGGRVPELVARGLAPLFDARASDRGAGTPRHVRLAALCEPQRGPLSAAQSILVTFGATATGTLRIDLEEHGPHMLAAGATGSGKSEFLQTVITGLACDYGPAELNLLLVDYKGGLAFAPFKDLPHVTGFVSDLTAYQADRVIAFLQREIERRKEELAKHGARDYRDFRSKGRSLARLVVVFDEFAAVLASRPGFIDSAVSIAQQGRALGIHLILATQRPSGQTMTADLRANSPIRVALRMLEEANSSAILGTTVAARISGELKGRGFVRVGDDAPLIFQSGHASYRAKDTENKAVGLRPFLLTNPTSPAPLTDEPDEDLARVVDRLKTAYRGAVKPEPQLGTSLDEYVPPPRSGHRDTIEFGFGDDPRHQTSVVYELGPSDAAILLVGGLGSGKTSSLTLFAQQFAGEIIAIDGRRELRAALSGRPWTTLVPADDLELVSLILDQLTYRLDERSKDSLDTLLLIDDVGSLGARLETRPEGRDVVTQLSQVIHAAGSRGLRVVASTRVLAECPTSLISGFETLLQLRTDAEDDLTRGKARGLPDGRAIDARTQVHLHLHRPNALSNETHHGAPGSYGRTLPVTDIGDSIGYDEVSGEPIKPDLRDHLIVVGPRRSGKTTALRRIAFAARSSGALVLELSAAIGSSAASLPDLNEVVMHAQKSLATSEHPSTWTPPTVVVDGIRRLPDDVQAALSTAAASGVIRCVIACESAGLDLTWIRPIRETANALLLAHRPSQQGSTPLFKIAGELGHSRIAATFPLGTALFYCDGQQRTIRLHFIIPDAAA